ncbi:MAG: nicotinate (nicotinamide) nucleotide adenylyltransferase [Candidatus Handelsmanbacteria bacterium RIFCSPLOWO2_12_FULL_64_10]|uniref:Probable nicotinate-nucleotide adenylyltransferase n=1 Tax=Handelsmanbacteria sp. (strain RIFCSPLOWO2_12_FULL_64_10) TaxID=1817868 RepID=A0A1F6CQK9_HANXR|nr:MAG: nicotinate (nicotinamide) nucleotide adenylyltransferase [Candidatus Handelsmanbacteria bacterium RIFCSPLOWO2_12_FULL_64_10]
MDPSPEQRVGLLGGVFDPVHNGHLIAAEAAREACGLRRVMFIPASDPPHKRYIGLASAQARAEMVRLAIQDHPCFELSPIELRRAGPSYTVDTLSELRQTLGENVGLFLIIGADNVTEIGAWHRPDRILSLATVVVVRRPGATPDRADPALTRGMHFVETPFIEISSTDIRRRVREGRSIRYLVPREVEKYIHEHELYR